VECISWARTLEGRLSRRKEQPAAWAGVIVHGQVSGAHTTTTAPDGRTTVDFSYRENGRGIGTVILVVRFVGQSRHNRACSTGGSASDGA